MKFSLVNGQRQEAKPNLAGVCPVCGSPMTARCGEIKAWHWAHRNKKDCDPWWENETEWHRNWKNRFPVQWQEIIQYASDGEKHIADVKTDQGWVIEFQHSRIQPEERRSRDNFYEKLVWVVDGTRLKRDIKQFNLAWKNGIAIGNNQSIRKLESTNCRILKEWSESDVPVFFDFGITDSLWWLHSKNTDGTINTVVFSQDEFVKTHLGTSGRASDFESLVRPEKQEHQSKAQVSSTRHVQPRIRRLVPRRAARRF